MKTSSPIAYSNHALILFPMTFHHVAALVACIAAPLLTLAQEFSWNQRVANGPSARASHAMAYDTSRGVTVLFGGTNGDTNNAETWEWNGTIWTQRLVNGPSARAYVEMSYDTARGVCVLFGGAANSGYNAETWEWDGTVWTQRNVNGPSARCCYAMAYDALRGVTVLFGGINSNSSTSSETWEWNGTDWTLRSIAGPSGRAQHTIAYDSSRGVTVLFGGFNNSGVNAETWEWNGTTWTQRLVSGPSLRYGHSMAYNSTRGTTMLFGGQVGDNDTGETWEWNGTAWTLRGSSGPSPRYSPSTAFDSARGTTVLFGGVDAAGFNSETWELSTPCLAPTIATQPIDQTTSPDAPVTFFVEATSGPGCLIPEPLTYQWQRRNPAIIDPNEQGAWINLSDGNGFTNTRTSALLITRSTLGLATGYRCLITGGCRCATGEPPITYTDTVNFSVACPADFNADGGINGEDIQAFFERWEAGC